MKIPCILILLFLIAGLTLPATAHALEKDDCIDVSGAWVRAMPPSATSTAAYMTIENRTDSDIVLKSAATDIARTVEIHQMKQVGDMMVMDKIDNLRIPAGARIELKPTGLHLMIIHLLRSIKEGENVQVILYFEGGKRVTVKAAVRKWNKAG